MPDHSLKYPNKLKKYLACFISFPKRYWQRGIINKIISIFLAVVFIASLAIFAIGEWYISTENNIPLTYGVSFIPDYASSLGLDPLQTYNALLGIGVRQFRLTSYWSDVEPNQGQYNFSQLDWEFALANRDHAKIILTVGLRQPRWPECHPPNWINTNGPLNSWEPQLFSYMKTVISRYKNNPALQAYQLENEYFLKGFGDCSDFSRSRLINEYSLVKKLDSVHPIIIGRSNNALGTPIGAPTPDLYGVSVYQRVWDAGVTHRYLEYPFPGWFYGFLAGIEKISKNRNMILLEMQAEAWPPHGQTIPQSSLAEQNKSLNPGRLAQRFQFGKSTGMKDVILWGAEYWYYRDTILHDPSVWNVAKAEFAKNDNRNGSYLFSHLN